MAVRSPTTWYLCGELIWPLGMKLKYRVALPALFLQDRTGSNIWFQIFFVLGCCFNYMETVLGLCSHYLFCGGPSHLLLINFWALGRVEIFVVGPASRD